MDTIKMNPDFVPSSGEISIEDPFSQTPDQLKAMVEELARSPLKSLISENSLFWRKARNLLRVLSRQNWQVCWTIYMPFNRRKPPAEPVVLKKLYLSPPVTTP